MEEFKSNQRGPNVNYHNIISGHGDPYMELESIGNQKLNRPAQKTGTEEELLKRRKNEVQKADLYTENEYDREIREMKERAWEQLQSFPLQNLRLAKTGTFNMTYSDSKEYIRLCKIVEVDPDEYYHNFKDQAIEPSQPKAVSKSNEKQESNEKQAHELPNVKNAQEKKKTVSKQEVSVQNPALQQLRAFNLEELVVNNNGEFDRRRNTTKEYLALCEAAGVQPDEYYLENFAGKSQVKDNGQVHGKKEGQVHDRKKLDSVHQKMAESQRKLDAFDKSQLKFKSDGTLDKRFKVNKEYMSLQEQCEESYYQNM